MISIISLRTKVRQTASADLHLVVHIPKTAGTSLRWALEQYFGKSRVIRDYGADNKATSDVVRNYLYSGEESKGAAKLIEAISAESAKILIGHFPLQKYVDYFETKNIITIVRDPLVRVCSEYVHRIKNKSFGGSFSDYLKKPRYQNLQSWFLEGASTPAVIGIAEHYRDSLQYINRTFDWNLKARKKNVAWFKGGRSFARTLSQQELDFFYTLNKKDMHLYETAKLHFLTSKRSGLKRTS